MSITISLLRGQRTIISNYATVLLTPKPQKFMTATAYKQQQGVRLVYVCSSCLEFECRQRNKGDVYESIKSPSQTLPHHDGIRNAVYHLFCNPVVFAPRRPFAIMVNANARLMKELEEVAKDDKLAGVQAVPVSEANLRHLKGTIQGPAGTCYDGGVFEVDIQVPNQYPFEPPKMKFITKVWHPNISSQTGAICLVRVRVFRECN